MSLPDSKEELIENYELERCISWINENTFNRVCLQFPDNLLVDSVDIALHIDEQIKSKTYILGDSSFFSCCVDELGSKHIDGDAIIHFGYSCLSPYTSLPVLYILPKQQLDLATFVETIKPVLESGSSLIVYDVSFAHLTESLDERLKTYEVCISQLASGSQLKRPCGPWCQGGNSHSSTKFGYSFCISDSLQSVIYVGTGKPADHFLLSMNVPQFFTYDENKGLEPHHRIKLLKKMSFLVEKVKNSAVFGLLVGTVSIERYLDAIEHIKRLLKRRKRKCFIISVGKPTVAKLSNFPEVDVFVMVSCNEGTYINNKEVLVPIVTLLELELAFNENRTWDDPISSDFSFLLQGGEGYVEAPINIISDDLVESMLTSGFRSSTQCTDSSTEVALRSDMTVSTSGFSSQPRTWDGLELKMNDTVPSTAVEGRRGTAQGYSSELS